MEEKILRGVFDFFEEYDIIRLEGKYVEKFFNIATKKNIKIWNVRYISKSVAVFSCYRKDYERIVKISDKISARIYIMDSKGIMHEVKKYKNRISLYAGVIIMCCIIGLLSNIVCEINVTGNERVPKELIISQLKESGLSRGRFVSSVDSRSVQKKMLAKNSDLSWIGISISGARAEVEIVEKVPKPYIVDKNSPANIVASKDGIIDSIVVKDGFPVAAKGDTVVKGQMLVSGINESTQGDLMLVYSSADVKIKTWNYLTESHSLNVTERIPDGEFSNRYYLNFFGNRINLFWGEEPHEDDYNIVKNYTQFFDLPVGIEKHECEKVALVNKKYSEKEIFERNKKSMYDKLVSGLSENHTVVDCEYNYTVDGDNVIIDLCVVAVEDGGVIQKVEY